MCRNQVAENCEFSFFVQIFFYKKKTSKNFAMPFVLINRKQITVITMHNDPIYALCHVFQISMHVKGL